jgi:hypothetical protein
MKIFFSLSVFVFVYKRPIVEKQKKTSFEDSGPVIHILSIKGPKSQRSLIIILSMQ